jgi:hypothetical protein
MIAMEEGVTELRVGARMVKVRLVEVPPPGGGVRTSTFAVPVAPRRDVATVACSCVALTNDVGMADPFHRTTEAFTKFDPFTFMVKAGDPANAEEGLRDVRVGAGLSMVNVNAGVSPPPGAGLRTRTKADPGLAIWAAVMLACTDVGLT